MHYCYPGYPYCCNTTDASGKENETVHCRFVKDGQPENRLIGHKAVAHGHTQGITHVIDFQCLPHRVELALLEM